MRYFTISNGRHFQEGNSNRYGNCTYRFCLGLFDRGHFLRNFVVGKQHGPQIYQMVLHDPLRRINNRRNRHPHHWQQHLRLDSAPLRTNNKNGKNAKVLPWRSCRSCLAQIGDLQSEEPAID